MNNYLVLTADGTKARFFRLAPAEYPELESGPNLIELEDLVNPELGQKGRDVWSDLKSGRSRAPNGGPAHGFDDHRDRHRDEIERRFARIVGAELINKLAQGKNTDILVIAAERRMLGMLRNIVEKRLPPTIKVRERGEDLGKLSAGQLHTHLAREGVIPARKPPGSRGETHPR